jgi:hypothetical protein
MPRIGQLGRYRSDQGAAQRAGAATAAIIPGGPAFQTDCKVAMVEALRMLIASPGTKALVCGAIPAFPIGTISCCETPERHSE